jgi:hypothetical protein
MTTLSPEYLDIDFNTFVEKIKTDLSNSDNQIFRDANYRGSNIAILIELLAYLCEIDTFFLNKIARNAFLETTDVYECCNRLCRLVGYEPKGHISGRNVLTITVSNCPSGGIKIPAWKQLTTNQTTDDGDVIKFAITSEETHSSPDISSSPTSAYTFSVNARQGEIITLPTYTGNDIIDNELLLPSNYAYDNDFDDDYPTILLSVSTDGIEFDVWNRVSDFYDEISGLTDTDNVYMLIYDKYKRSKILFNSSRNVPEASDEIEIKVLKSLGADGAVGANIEWTPETEFILNTTTSEYIDNSTISIANSAASVGAADPEIISTLRENAKAAAHSQYRDVNSIDYKSYLEARSDVNAALAWGEQEENPDGEVANYNKIYISVIPSSWGTDTIMTSGGNFTTDWGTSESIDMASYYSETFENTLSLYIEPRKVLTSYEIFVVPQLVYFSFDFGIRLKRNYLLSNVQEDILDKLIYYFRSTNMEFNSEINFMDILEYLVDSSETSATDDFSNIKGIRNLILRDISTNINVNNYGSSSYPRYTISDYTGENLLRPIQLGYNQFPVLSSGTIRFTEEG